MQLIIKLQLGRIQKRIAENHKIPFDYDDEVVNVIASHCSEVGSGAPVVDAILTNTVLPKIG
jgi:type VI secretion system protein VasG